MKYQYEPGVFVTQHADAAKQIILTPEAGLTPEERWVRETNWIAPILHFGNMPHVPHMPQWSTVTPPPSAGLILDYGCGIGRVSKLLPYPVVGVDISPSMRQQAEAYVGRPDFVTMHPPALDMLVRSGLRFDGAIALWVLQHVADPGYDIRLIHAALKPGATFWVLNREHRAVPAKNEAGEFSWIDDFIDIDDAVQRTGFDYKEEVPVPSDLCVAGAYLRRYARVAS